MSRARSAPRRRPHPVPYQPPVGRNFKTSLDESLAEIDHTRDSELLSRDPHAIASPSVKRLTTPDGRPLGSPVMPSLELSFTGHMKAFKELEKQEIRKERSIFRDSFGGTAQLLDRERDPRTSIRVVAPPTQRPCLDLKGVSSEEEFHGALLNGQHKDCMICFPNVSTQFRVAPDDPLRFTSDYLEHREQIWDKYFCKGTESIPPYDSVLDPYCPRVHSPKGWKNLQSQHSLIDEKTRMMNGRSLMGRAQPQARASSSGTFVPPFLNTLEERDAESFERLKYKWRQAGREEKRDLKKVVLNALMKGHNLVPHHESLSAVPSMEESPLTEYVVNSTRSDWNLTSFDKSTTQFPVKDHQMVEAQARSAERGTSKLFSGGNFGNHFRYTVAKVNTFKKAGSMELSANVHNKKTPRAKSASRMRSTLIDKPIGY